MAKEIVRDPDALNLDTEIKIDVDNKKIEVTNDGNMEDKKLSMQCLLSWALEEWKANDSLIAFHFIGGFDDNALVSYFRFADGWELKDSASVNKIADSGLTYVNADGAIVAEFMNIKTLGNFDADADKAYYQFDAGSAADFIYDDEVNELVQIYGDSDHGDITRPTEFTAYLRIQGKTYDEYPLVASQNAGTLTYRSYSLPLSNKTDTKITGDDATVDDYGVSVEYFADNQTRTIGGTDYNFKIIIDGNTRTKAEIYSAIQSLLRKDTDIDSGDGTVIGNTASSLLKFVGDTLVTSTGVYIDHFDNNDINDIEFYDVDGVKRTFPYYSAGALLPNDNIKAEDDGDTKFVMIFSAGYNTSDAVIVQNKDGDDITGTFDDDTNVTFNFDYDNNTQEEKKGAGARDAGTDADIKVIAVGIKHAQPVVVASTITKSKGINIALPAAEQLSYLNP